MISRSEVRMLDSARWYTERGFSVIPLSPGTKIPPKGFPVLEHRGHIATDDQLKEWFGKPANIAVCPCGFDVVDFDRGDWLDVAASLGIEDTFSYSTTRGGHIWVRGWNGQKIDGVDHKTKSGYVVVPPSVVGNTEYRWRHRQKLHALRVTNLPIVARHATRMHPTPPKEEDASCEGGVNRGGNSSVVSRNFLEIYRGPQNCHLWGFDKGARDETLTHVRYCLRRGGMRQERAAEVLEILAKNCNPPYENVGKIIAHYNDETPLERNIAAETREFVRTTNGPFRTTEVHKNLELTTKDHKKSCTTEIQRLAKAGEVVATGRINGEYRRLDRNLVKLDWEKADPSKPLIVNLPFQIETLVNLYHKNIAVVAGAPDAGKSAFMLNVVAMNMHQWKVRYFTSEMSEQELRLRLENFEEIPGGKWRFDAYERGRDFASVIDPNGLNIIDYMEVHDNFHLIAQWLDEIFRELKHGLAFVAIQKKRSTKDQQFDLGRGAEFSLERPRLYIAMDSGRLKIIKAKNWVRRDVNPNGREFNFKLVGGCKFLPDTDHHHEGKYDVDWDTLTVRNKEK